MSSLSTGAAPTWTAAVRYSPMVVLLAALCGGIVADRLMPLDWMFWWTLAAGGWLLWFVLLVAPLVAQRCAAAFGGGRLFWCGLASFSVASI